ncbi:hypothetical protein M3E73_11495, partial [Brevibacterium casei]|nr:hypothetical protein [Brevibacterium casei]
MTWHYETTIAEVVHRLRDDTGESVWGVENRGFDADHDATLGTESVLLPTGETEVLLVDPLPGGFVLDAVRAVHGLTEAEIHTLLRGCFAELAAVGDQASRLGLDCFALDAEGRPRLIPGVRHRLETSVRRAIGELIYHAAHGTPWAEALLPVDVALAENSAELRDLVAGLLDDDPIPRSGGEAEVAAAIAEVAPQLGRLPTPVPLPLVPAARDLDPAQAITARLRAAPAQAPAPKSGTAKPGDVGAGPGERSGRLGAAAALRAAATARASRSRPDRGERTRLRPRTPRSSPRRPGSTPSSWRARLRMRGSPVRWGIAASIVVAVLGGLLIVWSAADSRPAGPEQAAAQHPPASAGDGAGNEGPTDEDVIDRLGELCSERAAALSAGDGDALAALTVPGSSAAAADELIDLSAYAGGTYTVNVEDVAVVERTDSGIRVAARMTTSAKIGGEEERFGAEDVVFTLA